MISNNVNGESFSYVPVAKIQNLTKERKIYNLKIL